MNYSFNRDRSGIVFAGLNDVNASFKDLAMVCSAIRYNSVPRAMEILDSVISGGKPIEYRKYNSHLGSRHELNGRKGRYPIKCAKLVKKALESASANARSKGYEPDLMYVVHAAANKKQIIMRTPPKGRLFVITGGWGYSPLRRSDIELSKIEIGLGTGNEKGLGNGMKAKIMAAKAADAKKPAPKAKQQPKVKLKAAEKPQEKHVPSQAKKPSAVADSIKRSADPSPKDGTKQPEDKTQQRQEKEQVV
ncbi:MAG: uL22 family ribosomal protein [Candidatus Micrarchaeaceae archaeon]